MSEMSAEKKKQIEAHIIKSYFGGCKNVKSWVGGVDFVKGTDDGCIPQLLVGVTYFGEYITINWNVYDEFDGDPELENSFVMRVCRELEIERNRCDSVDAMTYAWTAWKNQLEEKRSLKTEKDKRIEELEREVKALRAENEELKKASHVLDPLPDFRDLLKKIYSTNDVEKLEWTLNHACGGRGSVNGWIAVSLFWKQKCTTISKIVGFSSVEEIQDYLTNEANCDTLHESISNLHDEVKYASNERNDMDKKLKACEKEVKSLRAEINKFYEMFDDCEPAYVKQRIDEMKDEIKNLNKKLSERTHIVYLNDPIGVIARWERVTGYDNPEAFLKWKAYIEGIMEEWKSGTGCKYPAEARILLEKWKVLTKCETPEAAATWITSYESACERGNELAEGAAEREKEWQDATGRISPEAAKQYIDRLTGRLNKIHDYSVDW